MIRHLFTFPDNFADQIRWLEELVAGPHLAQVVSDLIASRPDRNERISIDVILGPDKESARNSGLNFLKTGQVRLLFHNPEALLELQELVLRDASDYWIELLCRENDSIIPMDSTDLPQINQQRPDSTGVFNSSYRGIAFAVLALAASVFLIFRLWQINGTGNGTVNWGWAKPGAIAQFGDRNQYLLALTSSAEEWFNMIPSNSDQLLKRIDEFQKGCQVILSESHSDLSELDRAWLKERCGIWNNKLSVAADDLRRGKPVDQVLSDVNTIATNLVKALKERART